MPIKTSYGKWKWGNIERDSKKELVQTVYGIWKKNGSKGSFSDFLKGTHESVISENNKIYAYHCTDVDPEIIKKDGWKVGKGFTISNQFEDLYKKYFPNVPVFVSRLDVPIWDSKSKYCIKLDITGLELFPDFGHLPDFGAYYDYDEECFYWENEDDFHNKELKKFILNNCDDLTLYADNFSGKDSFNVLGTACVDGSKLKDRIVEYVSMQTGKRVKSESYEPPYTLDTIKQKYGDEVYRKLRDDPVHRFRAETGIEVIHKEPTKDEFERIVKNWDLMTPEQKKQSDEFSNKIFGNNNKNRIELLRKEYDFKVGDKVKVREGLRCFQSGHTGKIIEIEPPNKYGWSSFVIKFDEPRLGAMGFYSGDIDKINESVILDESKVDTTKLFFHGTGRKVEKLDKPEVWKPFFVSADLDYALSYAEWRDTSYSAVYLVKVNEKANVFDPTNPIDLAKLESLNFWPEEVIVRLKSGADILMVMQYAAAHKLVPNLTGSGAISHRDMLCRQLQKLGYDMFKTSEEVDKYSSDFVYGIFTLNGLESLYPKAISIEKAKEIEKMIKRHVRTSEILKRL